MVADTATGEERLGFDSLDGQIGHNSHRCDVSSKLYCPGAKSDPATRHTLRRNAASVMKT